MNGQVEGQLFCSVVVVGIGPVFELLDFFVMWTRKVGGMALGGDVEWLMI